MIFIIQVGTHADHDEHTGSLAYAVEAENSNKARQQAFLDLEAGTYRERTFLPGRVMSLTAYTTLLERNFLI